MAKNEIRTETTNEKTPFKRWNITRKTSIEFSEDPKFRVNSKDLSIKEYTNKNAIDTNIYDVIEKYRGDLKMSAAELNVFHSEVAQELSEIKSLPDALKQMQKAESAWKNLPLDVRKDFGYSINKFMQHGETYLNKKISAYNQQIELQKQQAQANAQAQVQKPTTGEVI